MASTTVETIRMNRTAVGLSTLSIFCPHTGTTERYASPEVKIVSGRRPTPRAKRFN